MNLLIKETIHHIVSSLFVFRTKTNDLIFDKIRPESQMKHNSPILVGRHHQTAAHVSFSGQLKRLSGWKWAAFLLSSSISSSILMVAPPFGQVIQLRDLTVDRRKSWSHRLRPFSYCPSLQFYHLPRWTRDKCLWYVSFSASWSNQSPPSPQPYNFYNIFLLLLSRDCIFLCKNKPSNIHFYDWALGLCTARFRLGGKNSLRVRSNYFFVLCGATEEHVQLGKNCRYVRNGPRLTPRFPTRYWFLRSSSICFRIRRANEGAWIMGS